MNFTAPSSDAYCRRRPAGGAFLAALGRLSLVIVLMLSVRIVAGEIKEQIVAVINDEIITYSELERILAPIFEQYERIYSGAELFSMLQKARRDVLNHLIEEKLIVQEAKKQNIKGLLGDEFAKDVEQSIAQIKAKFPSEEEFLKQMKREGTTMERFRAQQEDRTLVKAMLIKEASSKCSVSPMEVREYYDSHKEEFTESEKIHVSQIWIREKPEKPGEAERVAKEILGRLNAGEPFAELAKKYSHCPYASRGGDWGFIGRGHWNKELEDAAFALEPGAHSGIVKSSLGYHIIMLHEKKPSSVKPLTQVYAEIEGKLFNEKASTKRDEWITRLKNKAYISVVK
jgi:parvulin-like peptidyl-prolyl isomerase